MSHHSKRMCYFSFSEKESLPNTTLAPDPLLIFRKIAFTLNTNTFFSSLTLKLEQWNLSHTYPVLLLNYYSSGNFVFLLKKHGTLLYSPNPPHSTPTPLLSTMALIVSLYILWGPRYMTCGSLSFPKSYHCYVCSVFRGLSNSLTFTNFKISFSYHKSLSFHLSLPSSILLCLQDALCYLYLPSPT